MKSIILGITLVLSLIPESRAAVRTVSLKHDQLLDVRTALGIATIIQTPGPIQSAIIGDQSAFKIEYLNNAVTVKPLRFGAKTNLYLVTEKERFSVRLRSLDQKDADYIVYINTEQARLAQPWKTLNRFQMSKGTTLTINRLALSADGVLLIDGRLNSKSARKIDPASFHLIQGSASKLIDSLFLSAIEVSKDKPIRFGMSVSAKSLDMRKTLTVMLVSEGSELLVPIKNSELRL